MLQYALWGISFVTLWLSIVWLGFLYSEPDRKSLRSLVTVAIPVFSVKNDKDPIKTLKSVFDSGYPVGLLDVIVVDDGSKDDVVKKLRAFQKTNAFRLFSKQNHGKASALNLALEHAKGDFFAVVDADSRISSGSIQLSLSNFTNKNIGAVISRVRVDVPVSFLERIQRFEYIMSGMIRKIMCNLGTLHITPGVLSIYRTSVLRKLNGFTRDRNNFTEDLEIAMRLKYNGYKIVMEPESVTYTSVPNTFSLLWRQRTRWTRGYILNHWNYRSMFFSEKHGFFGFFQLPINIFAVILLIANIGIISLDFFNRISDFVFRSITVPGYFITMLTDFPTIKEFVLARNVQVFLPVVVAFMIGVYLIILAHRFFSERLRGNFLPAVSYILVMPYFSAINWVSSIVKELARSKRRW